MLSQFFLSGWNAISSVAFFIGLGVALLFATTGRMGGISTFFSAAWSYGLKLGYFQRPRDP